MARARVEPAGGTEAAAALAAELSPVRIAALFPPVTLRRAARRAGLKEGDELGFGGEGAVLWALRCPELERELHRAIFQCYMQTKRRAERLPVEDAEFFAAEKSRKAEERRRTFRTGTRAHRPVPERRRPLSALLCPAAAGASAAARRPLAWTIAAQPSRPPARDPEAPFPGSVPVSLMAADLPELARPDLFWALAPKTVGTRRLPARGMPAHAFCALWLDLVVCRTDCGSWRRALRSMGSACCSW